MTRIERNELKKVGRPGIRPADIPPTGISPILRASWKFVCDTARRYAQELNNPEEKEAKFRKEVIKRFE
ncbi:MAG: hypothetical protein PHH14_05905 [Candidatus Margulisbacteria bacterium]|nr:hypothetical protein [Candidatus Margulisiibacteriota bacterium]